MFTCKLKDVCLSFPCKVLGCTVHTLSRNIKFFWMVSWVKELMRLLQSHGIDFSFSWRNFVELYEEIYEKKQSRLEVNFESNLAKHHGDFFFRKSWDFGTVFCLDFFIWPVKILEFPSNTVLELRFVFWMVFKPEFWWLRQGVATWIVASWSSTNPRNSLWPYCWWKKSCTSWYVVYPVICKVLYIPGG